MPLGVHLSEDMRKEIIQLSDERIRQIDIEPRLKINKSDDVIGQIVAEDRDEENTVNTRINFEILSITTDTGDEVPEEMFYLANQDEEEGTVDLVAGIDMQGYFGTYILTIETKDEGVYPGPLSNISDVTVQINKYNFYNPQFTFPENGMHFNLRSDQNTFAQLLLYNDEGLPDFTASDRQNDKYELEFSVVSEDSIFDFVTREATSARLVVTEAPVPDTTYQVILRVQAVDATPVTTTDITITIVFLDLSREPIYVENTQTIEFEENSTIIQYETFNQAFYEYTPENLEFLIYYMITGDNPGGFAIENPNKNTLTTTVVLDREEVSSYTITIPAFRRETGQANPGENSILTLTINVRDINDNPPNFDQPIFYAIITPAQAIGSTILTLTATDLDDDDRLLYTIESFPIIPDSVNSAAPFIVNELTGVITNDVQVLDNVDGLFHLKVKVFDGLWSHTADVVIYIVSDVHRVEFLFQNDVNIIDGTQTQIASILEAQFGYTCIIEQVIRNTNSDGNAIDNETIVRVYFIDADTQKPILKADIEESANDVQTYIDLVNQFERYQLVLVSFLQNSGTTENREEVLRAWLIGITLVLGVLCMLLIVAFILKTRSLTTRLNKLSVIRYGSQESVNNRRAAPFTNRHAAEGSNPAYDEEKVKSHENEDAASVGSGDSDLVGVENNPEFDYNVDKRDHQTTTS
ncbi:Cadherin domain [Popillia japonica]|uniref:Cadherin domain n=1 Tax=Popillia japonica TaxID=7064 RepID=A0AAW1M1J2_POPJA